MTYYLATLTCFLCAQPRRAPPAAHPPTGIYQVGCRLTLTLTLTLTLILTLTLTLTLNLILTRTRTRTLSL